jgi:hypothetical protein
MRSSRSTRRRAASCGRGASAAATPDYGNGVATGSGGDVFTAGTYGTSGTFAGTTLTSAGYGDVFLAHFLP